VKEKLSKQITTIHYPCPNLSTTPIPSGRLNYFIYFPKDCFLVQCFRWFVGLLVSLCFLSSFLCFPQQKFAIDKNCLASRCPGPGRKFKPNKKQLPTVTFGRIVVLGEHYLFLETKYTQTQKKRIKPESYLIKFSSSMYLRAL
jgi:hypothetical protein